MSATIISTSPNIASLDLKVVADLCSGIFRMDITPSVWIGSGEKNVLGANFQITNPLGVVVKPYGSNYEIAPGLSGGMDAIVTFAVPTIGGGFQLGKYQMDVQLYDSNGAVYTNTKTVSICAPDALKKTLKYGSLSAKLVGNCQDGKMAVIVDGVPNYNGKIVESQVNAFTLDYPTASGLTPLDSAYTNFSVVLFEGVYLLVGTICATYNFGDNVFVKILYKVKSEHNQRCLIDLCCINDAFASLRVKINSDCSDKEKALTASTMVEALFLLENARLAAGCGEDPSDIISQLETLLGCSCTCNCNEGTPIINGTPVADSSIEGCGFTKETVGLTTVYTLYNYSYVVEIADNGGALTIADPTLADCTQTQRITFSINTVYSQIKELALTDVCAWANIVRRCFTNLDLTCLNITAGQLALMSFEQILQAIVNANCNTSECTAKLTNVEATQEGQTIKFTWTEDAFTHSVEIIVNNIVVASILAGVGEYVYILPVVNQRVESYVLTPRCDNRAYGEPTTGSISLMGRTFVAPPIVYSPYLQGGIPYDLTTNVEPLPLGVVAEWHFNNNTNTDSLVDNPTIANPGTYFVFGKDTNGFYSTGVQVQLTADLTGSCTAPQNLQVVPQFGGNQIKFQSAAYPPPLNSYTVKRRLTSDSDIPANYTTIGTPAWNAPISRWVISDNTAVDNQLYTYRAFSNCGTTLPYIDAQYAAINCPTLSLTPKVTAIDYSFVPIGGAIDKVEVIIYSDNGVTVVHTDTHLPGFSNPTIGSFFYLDPNRNYFIGTKAYIGSYVKVCPLQQMKTLMSTATVTLDYVAGGWSLNLSNPLAAELKLKVATVVGSADVCVTPLQNDLLTSNLIIPAGSLSASEQNNGLSYLSIYYMVTNSADFETYGVKIDGNTFVVAGATVTLRINHIICGFYPA